MVNKSSGERIIDAFRKLIANNSYASIRITDIIKLAEVSRISFYRNFEDKSALVTSICFQDFRSFVHIFGQNATWKQIMTCILNSMKNNPSFYRNVIINDEGMACIYSAMKKVAIEHTSSTSKAYLYPIYKQYLQDWAKMKFSTPVETIYYSLVSQLPACEILPKNELHAAIAKFESRTINDFKNRNLRAAKDDKR